MERLHSTQSGGPARGVNFGALGPPPARTAAPVLASLPGPTHRQLLKRYADAKAAKRKEILSQDSIRLFSIVFAYYRPGPGFLAGHTLAAGTLNAKITPGGDTWSERLASLSAAPEPFENRL